MYFSSRNRSTPAFFKTKIDYFKCIFQAKVYGWNFSAFFRKKIAYFQDQSLMDENLVCFQGKNRLFYCIFKTKVYGWKLSVCFKAKMDSVTVFSRPKFMDGQADRREKSLLNPQTGFLAMLTSIPEAQSQFSVIWLVTQIQRQIQRF